MGNETKIADMLSNHSIFSSLSKDKICTICDDPRCSIVSSVQGKNIINSSSQSSALGLILEGTVLVYRKGNGTPVLLQSLSEGKLFGASTLFSDSTDYLTELKAGSNCSVFFIPSEIVTELIMSEPSFAIDYVTFLSGKIRFLNERLNELSAPSTLQKLASFLLRGDERITVSKVQLASVLGIGRASLYRALDELVERAYISTDEKAVTIIDRNGLISLI